LNPTFNNGHGNVTNGGDGGGMVAVVPSSCGHPAQGANVKEGSLYG